MTAPPYSPLVLGPAALLTAPALWDTLVAGTMPFETGLMRLAVAIGVVWVGLAMLGTLLTQPAAPATAVVDTHQRGDAQPTPPPS